MKPGLRWWDRSLWWRTYTPNGFDGWCTSGGRKLTVEQMNTAMAHPGLRDALRQVAAPARSHHRARRKGSGQ